MYFSYKSDKKKLEKNEKKYLNDPKNQFTTGYLCKLLWHNKI